jgi:hypothetical protein
VGYLRVAERDDMTPFIITNIRSLVPQHQLVRRIEHALFERRFCN